MAYQNKNGKELATVPNFENVKVGHTYNSWKEIFHDCGATYGTGGIGLRFKQEINARFHIQTRHTDTERIWVKGNQIYIEAVNDEFDECLSLVDPMPFIKIQLLDYIKKSKEDSFVFSKTSLLEVCEMVNENYVYYKYNKDKHIEVMDGIPSVEVYDFWSVVDKSIRYELTRAVKHLAKQRAITAFEALILVVRDVDGVKKPRRATPKEEKAYGEGHVYALKKLNETQPRKLYGYFDVEKYNLMAQYYSFLCEYISSFMENGDRVESAYIGFAIHKNSLTDSFKLKEEEGYVELIQQKMLEKEALKYQNRHSKAIEIETDNDRKKFRKSGDYVSNGIKLLNSVIV